MAGTLPSATFRAALGGFQDPDNDELLAPYATRFFDVVADVWRDWGSDMAQYFAENAYPVTVISQQALDDATASIGRGDLPAPLRRLLSEGRDDVARALRNRQRDAQSS